nr:MAG TPA: hypothetical protein [Bacteriophage sp.]
MYILQKLKQIYLTRLLDCHPGFARRHIRFIVLNISLHVISIL